jgi:hypothetical protein
MMRRVVLGKATGSIETVQGNVAEVRFDTGARCPVPLTWLSPAPGCAECGGPIEAKRSTRKYCSDACRIRAFRCNAKTGGTDGTGATENAREAARGNVREAA